MREAHEVETIGPLLGWRLWRHYRAFHRQRQHWLLRSLSCTHYWPPLEAMRAECSFRGRARHRLDDVPNIRCRCGLYAYKLAPSVEERHQAIERAIYLLGDFLVAIVGTVSLWGRIIEHEEGWRAEYAYPSSLCVLYVLDGEREAPCVDEIAAGLAEAYEVPVRTCAIFPKDGWRWSAGVEWELDDVLGWAFREVNSADWQRISSVAG